MAASGPVPLVSIPADAVPATSAVGVVVEVNAEPIDQPPLVDAPSNPESEDDDDDDDDDDDYDEDDEQVRHRTRR